MTKKAAIANIENIIDKNIILKKDEIVVQSRLAANEIYVMHKKEVDSLKKKIAKLNEDLYDAWNTANMYQFMAD